MLENVFISQTGDILTDTGVVGLHLYSAHINDVIDIDLVWTSLDQGLSASILELVAQN